MKNIERLDGCTSVRADEPFDHVEVTLPSGGIAPYTENDETIFRIEGEQLVVTLTETHYEKNRIAEKEMNALLEMWEARGEPFDDIAENFRDMMCRDNDCDGPDDCTLNHLLMQEVETVEVVTYPLSACNFFQKPTFIIKSRLKEVNDALMRGFNSPYIKGLPHVIDNTFGVRRLPINYRGAGIPALIQDKDAPGGYKPGWSVGIGVDYGVTPPSGDGWVCPGHLDPVWNEAGNEACHSCGLKKGES